MSKTSPIGYGGSDEPFIWAFDVARAIWMRYLIDAAVHRGLDQPPHWMAAEIESWRVTASVSDYMWLLDESWTEAQKTEFLDVARQACDALSAQPTLDSAEVSTWSLIEDEPLTSRIRADDPPINTRPIVELGEAVMMLVEGTPLPDPPPGRHWYFGFPGGRKAI